MTSHLRLALLALPALCACGQGPARPRLTQINSDMAGPIVFSYEGNQLVNFKSIDSKGTVRYEAAVECKDGRISTVTRTEPGKKARVFYFAYTNGLLGSISSINSDDSSQARTLTFTYEGARLAKLEDVHHTTTSTLTNTRCTAGNRAARLPPSPRRAHRPCAPRATPSYA